MKEWCVDWEVEVPIELLKNTVTVTRTEIIEAESAEQAIEVAKEQMWVDESDLDHPILDATDVQVGRPNLDTFKTLTPVTQWGE